MAILVRLLIGWLLCVCDGGFECDADGIEPDIRERDELVFSNLVMYSMCHRIAEYSVVW